MSKTEKLYNFVYSCQIDGGCEPHHITIEDAVYDLLAWAEEDPDIINDMGDPLPSEFRDAWNHVCDILAA